MKGQLMFACLIMASFEARAFWKLLGEYSKDHDVNEFILMAPLDKILSLSARVKMIQILVVTAWLMPLIPLPKL